MVGFCFLLELDILCVYNGKKVATRNICSLMFLYMFYYNVFIKVKKHVFMFFLILKSMF